MIDRRASSSAVLGSVVQKLQGSLAGTLRVLGEQNKKRKGEKQVSTSESSTSSLHIQAMFWLLEKHITMRLVNPQSAPWTPITTTAVTKADLQITKRA
jgi:hypothetical protein